VGYKGVITLKAELLFFILKNLIKKLVEIHYCTSHHVIISRQPILSSFQMPGPTCLLYVRNSKQLVPIAIQLMPEKADDNPVSHTAVTSYYIII